MDKNKLIEIKKRLLALGLVGVILGTVGCTNNKDKNRVPKHEIISSEFSNVDNYYKYVVQNKEVVKLYNSSNVYLFFNKETYEVSEYIYNKEIFLGGLANYIELYDLPSENLIFYTDGISRMYNKEFYKYLIENNYLVCLTEVCDYVEGYTAKDYYSLDEIKELEPQIAESLKIINYVKTKTK